MVITACRANSTGDAVNHSLMEYYPIPFLLSTGFFRMWTFPVTVIWTVLVLLYVILVQFSYRCAEGKTFTSTCTATYQPGTRVAGRALVDPTVPHNVAMSPAP